MIGVKEIRRPAKFYIGKYPVEYATDPVTQEERPIRYKDAVFFTVINSKNDVPDLRATPEHMRAFPTEWARFEASDEYKEFQERETDSDTPYTVLEDVTSSPTLCDELRALGIHSAEELLKRERDVRHFRGIHKVLDKARRVCAQNAAAAGQQPSAEAAAA